MVEGIFVWVLLIGLVGLIWVMVLDRLDGNRHTHDKRQGSPSQEPHTGEEPREHSSRQSKVSV